ncbi:LANO_0C00628g1_1 [Lachancea nothofagi CBS 11611]|uniref:LANO_0C00628g1_1 n=1 Tax=Lachancea nothofagi CBS 11611 TaxID=1266666 RepID=A0A1G4J359_9SACH|nr:LANO_0C00628g1_1 [Lachancea nothofagi CBS 11611]
MSAGSSPSRQLSESLGKFHISSPKFKPYVENDDFQDSEFNSQVQGIPSGKSYVSKLGNWSVNYGTVQQHDADSENVEPPQWKQYMQEQEERQDLRRKAFKGLKPRDDLVVTSSLSDISLIPTNTFKNRGSRPPNVDSERSVVQDRDSAIDTDVDPAREALGVFNNVLRHQRSNFFTEEPQDQSARSVSEEYDSTGSTGSSSSYDSFDPSVSPSLRQRDSEQPKLNSNGFSKPQKTSPRRPLKLITPEDAGMVFNYKEGVWDQPSAAVDASTSGAQDESSEAKIVSFKLPRTRPDQSIIDDTPLSTPRMDQKFMAYDETDNSQSRSTSGKSTTTMRTASVMPADTTHNLVDNVTSISELDTSFRIARGAVVSALVDTIPRKEIWERISELSLKQKHLDSLVGLNDMTPAVSELDVSHNKINSLQGAPVHLVKLCCAHNRIGSYCRLDSLEHLEDLDLSHNLLSTNLSLLAGCIHLRNVNLSQNGITSLQGLSESRARIETLNMSRNRLIGPLDFAELASLDAHKPNFLTYVRELDLSGNKITRIKNLHLLKNLSVLRLDGNPLESLDGNSSRSLRTLGALGCSALRSLGDFPRLRILRASGESLQILKLPETLEHFELVGAPSEAIPWGSLPPALRRLRLNRTNINELPKHFAAQCPGLQSLLISENDFKGFTRLMERLPGNLQVLDIRKNPLSQLQQEIDREAMTEAIALALPTLKKVFL